MKQLSIVVLLAIFCLVQTIPVPEPDETIDLVNIPLSNNKELDILTLAEKDGTINERNKRTIGILRELFPQLSQMRAVEEENILEPSSAGTDAFETIRVARETNTLNNNQDNQINNNDQETQASDQQAQAAEQNSSSAVDELTFDNLDDNEDRGKRFLNFGAASSSGNGASSSGSAGGSGNFLFDIIRLTADRVARGAGSAYRIVAGTESLDEAIKNFNSDVDNNTINIDTKDDFNEARAPRSGNFSLLVSGSSGTEQQDEKANAPIDSTDVGKGDGYTEGIPGPVTRLFVLANRGLSNLIQDLILRIAQTSERVVNFKARLITSLI